MSYLNFAIGNGIGGLDCEDDIPAVGLEHLCFPFPEPEREELPMSSSTSTMHPLQTLRPSSDPSLIQKEDPAALSPTSTASSSLSLSDFASAFSDEFEMRNSSAGCSYGPVSDKIGEVATCWLARWGSDMLAYEEQVSMSAEGDQQTIRGRRPMSYDSSAPSSSFIPPVVTDVPHIWRKGKGGLSTKWCCTLLGADSFFVKSERDRYEMAKRVVDLRNSLDDYTFDEDEDEREWTDLFSHGIHYMHMVCL